MREIKFRAWGKKTHNMGNVITLIYPYGGGFDEVKMSHNGSSIWVKGDEVEIMQYTGLKDRHGVEIYEGDLVRSFSNINKKSDPHLSATEPTYRTSSVEFYNGAFRLTCDEFPHGCGILNNYVGAMAEDLEVIGNIYQNPELLKKED